MKKIDFWKKEERESEERESSGKRERRFGRWKNVVMLPMKLKGKDMVWGEWGKGGAI
jgi:hypothetical protein